MGSLSRMLSCRACLIYGALPPETRRQQAKLFNETDNEYDVLVASDAVGMGLNLNIGRIIFTSLVKNIGGKKSAISTSEIKQIAGMLFSFCSLLRLFNPKLELPIHRLAYTAYTGHLTS